VIAAAIECKDVGELIHHDFLALQTRFQQYINLKHAWCHQGPVQHFVMIFLTIGLSTTGVTFCGLEDLTILQAMLLIAFTHMANSGSWAASRFSGGRLLLLHCVHCY
jgi:hypothetical protein